MYIENQLKNDSTAYYGTIQNVWTSYPYMLAKHTSSSSVPGGIAGSTILRGNFFFVHAFKQTND